MFEDLKKNLEQEKKIIADLHSIETSMRIDASNQSFYSSSFNSLVEQLRLLNKTVPNLLKEGSLLKKFVGAGESGGVKKVLKVGKKEAKPEVIRMSYVSPAAKEKRYITINKEDKKEFLEELKLSESGLAGMEKIKKKKTIGTEVHKPSLFAKYSNKYFLSYSEKFAPQFSSLAQDLKKANMRFMLSTYISMALFSAVLTFFAGILLYGFLLILNLGNWIHIWIPIISPLIILFIFYIYPSSEANSVMKKITQELPFATIHMAAIASSNVEPTKIFKIIAMSNEYPYIGVEMKKIIAQIDIYGYDLVTSLKNVARRTSSKKLSELFSGLATNISGGGELGDYLGKKSENFLIDYKLERQSYAGLAATFMDVYISILIAAPLVLMMVLIVMKTAGLGAEFASINVILFISVGAIIVANIIYLVVLNIKQPVL